MGNGFVDTDLACSYITKNEGFRQHCYHDTENVLTIGIGFNLHEGLSREESELILNHRIGKFTYELVERVPVFIGLSPIRKIVLLDMAYNLGVKRLLGFRKMLAALEKRDYQLAAKEMLDSRYASQVKNRAKRNAYMMETDKWYEDAPS